MLFHKDIGFPLTFTQPTGRVELIYTNHAKSRSEFKNIRILKSLTLDRCDIVEIEIIGRKVVKVLVRATYDNVNDICLALSPSPRGMVVKTAWLNRIGDTHNTLDETRYERV